MSKVVTFICCWKAKVIGDRKSVSYEGPLPIVMLISYRGPFKEFIDKLYQVIGYEKQRTWLAGACRYPVAKEYITLPTTD